MARRQTPRPSYTTPTVLRPPDVVHHLWGDEESGLVGDEVLMSSDLLHALIFTLPPGGKFGHSQDNRTVFAADEVYVVLEGTIAIANPQSGEVCVAAAGEFVFFRRDTWHHGINRSSGPARVLELFAPPPAAGTASTYAKNAPYLDDVKYTRDDLLGNWPEGRSAAAAKATLHHIRRADETLRLEGDLLVGVVASTEHLTVTENELLAGDRSDLRVHSGDAFFIVTEGAVHVHTPDSDGPNWWAVPAGDAFVVPQGFSYRLINQGGSSARFVFGSAPGYLPSST